MGQTTIEAPPEVAGRIAQAFYRSDPHGLYRGEALLELGRIAVEHRVNPTLADQYFQQLDEWLTEIRQRRADQHEDEMAALPDVMPAAVSVITPPGKQHREDDWGNIKRNPILPGHLVNRKTTPWYLDHLEEQCAQFRGFLAFAKGDNEAALKHYVRIPKLNPTISGGGNLATNPNDYHRLKFGADNGYLVAYPQELRLYNDRQRFAVLLGDFYYVTQQFSKATEMCDRLLASEFGRLTTAQHGRRQCLVPFSCFFSTNARSKCSDSRSYH